MPVVICTRKVREKENVTGSYFSMKSINICIYERTRVDAKSVYVSFFKSIYLFLSCFSYIDAFNVQLELKGCFVTNDSLQIIVYLSV